MRIVTLIENTECEPNSVCSHELKNEHGLSFYVETPHHKLLMDTGSTEAVWYNADMLGAREYLEAFGLRAEHRATAEEALADLPALAPAVVLLNIGKYFKNH